MNEVQRNSKGKTADVVANAATASAALAKLRRISKVNSNSVNLKVNVRIVSAKVLGSAKGGIFSRPSPYCICEVPDKPETRFQTKVMVKSMTPKWNHEQVIKSFQQGDTVVISVMDNQVLKKDKLIGTVTLTSKQVIQGFRDEDLKFDWGSINLEVYAKASAVLTKALYGEESGDEDLEATINLQDDKVPMNRTELKLECFKILDSRNTGLLGAYEMYRLVQRFDFSGNFDDWNKEYLKFCVTYKLAPNKGVSQEFFMELLDDRSTMFYCGDGDLQMLFQELQLAQSGSKELPIRSRLLNEIFDCVDIEKTKRLNLEEMRRFARAVGFPGSDEDWAVEFDVLCEERGWDSKAGITRREFKQLVNDEDGGVFCIDEHLLAIKQVLESQAKARAERIREIADICFEKSDCMNKDDLYNFFDIIGKLKLINVTENGEAWEKEYLLICKKYKRHPEVGLTRDNWTDLLDKKSSWTYCKDRELSFIAKEIKKQLQPEPEDRAKSLKTLFDLCDANQDGRLTDTELRLFAVSLGWKGNRHTWPQEYKKVCAQCQRKPDEGLDIEAFRALVDDMEYEHGVYYCTDEALTVIIHKFQHSNQASTTIAKGAALSRRAQAKELFQMYDTDNDSRMREADLCVFARHIGFQGTDAEWAEEYRVLCLEQGWNMQTGLSVENFIELIDSKDSGVYRSNEEIAKMLEDLQAQKEGKNDGKLARRSSQRWPEPVASMVPAEKEICVRCGASIVADHTFCGKCGTRLHAVTEESEASSVAAAAPNANEMWSPPESPCRDYSRSATEPVGADNDSIACTPPAKQRAETHDLGAGRGAAMNSTQASAKGKPTSRPDKNARSKAPTGPTGPWAKDSGKVKTAVAGSGAARGKKVATGTPPKKEQHVPERRRSSENSENEALKVRANLIVEVFRACDTNDDGFLREAELYTFAVGVGFPGRTTEWAKEYRRLCAKYGWKAETGIDKVSFVELVDSKGTYFYCDDSRLQNMRADLLYQSASHAVHPGTVLVCVRDKAVKIFKSVSESEVVGVVSPGMFVTASGPAQTFDKTIMVPIKPKGAVQWSFFKKAPVQMNRDALILAVFAACDANHSGSLREVEMFRLGFCLGFPGSEAEWAKEYRSICRHMGVLPADGLTDREFAGMVSDEHGVFYCSDQKLAGILAMLPNADAFRGMSNKKKLLVKQTARASLSITDLAADVFRTLDVNCNSRVSEDELMRFIICVQGDPEAAKDWARNSRVQEICAGVNPRVGVDLRTFCRLVSDPRSPFYCKDEKLASLGATVAWDMRIEKQREAAVTKIQASHRGKMARKETKQVRDAKKQDERVRTQQHHAALKIQSHRRGQQTRKEMKKQIDAAVKIQASFRGKAVRKRQAQLRGSLVGTYDNLEMGPGDQFLTINGFSTSSFASKPLSASSGSAVHFSQNTRREILEQALVPVDGPVRKTVLNNMDTAEAMATIDRLLAEVSQDNPISTEAIEELLGGVQDSVKVLVAQQLQKKLIARISKVQERVDAQLSEEEAQEAAEDVADSIVQILNEEPNHEQQHAEIMEEIRRAKDEHDSSVRKALAEEEEKKERLRARVEKRKAERKKSWISTSKLRHNKATENGELQQKSALLRSVREGDELAALAIIEHSDMGLRYYETNKTDGRECTVFHSAAESGMVRVVKALLSRPRVFHEAGKPDHLGWTALHRAVRGDQAAVVKALLEHSKFTDEMRNAKGNEGWSALHLAAFHGHQEIAELLLSHENFNQHDLQDIAGRTALHVAADRGWTPLCDLIAEHPRFTKKYAKNCQGKTAAETAADYMKRDDKATGSSTPRGLATPRGQTTPYGQTTPRGKTPPRGQTTPRGQNTPRGPTTPRGETTPCGKTTPRGETTSRGKSMPHGETMPRAKTPPRGDTALRAKAAPRGNTTPRGRSVPR